MNIHIIIKPRNTITPRGVIRAGTVQFNRWFGRLLKAEGTATLWWKNNYIHARANEHNHHIVSFEIPENNFSHLLHFGFSIEILKNNQPIYSGEWTHNAAFSAGLTIKFNLESIQSQPRSDIQTVTVYPHKQGIEAAQRVITHQRQ